MPLNDSQDPDEDDAFVNTEDYGRPMLEAKLLAKLREWLQRRRAELEDRATKRREIQRIMYLEEGHMGTEAEQAQELGTQLRSPPNLGGHQKRTPPYELAERPTRRTRLTEPD